MFTDFILLGVVNDSCAYRQPFVEHFVHASYDREIDACYLVTHICISTSPLHNCSRNHIACAQFIFLDDMPQSFVTSHDMHDDNTSSAIHHMNAWFCSNANHICFFKCLSYFLLPHEFVDGDDTEHPTDINMV